MWFASSSAVKQFWKAEFGRVPENFGCPFSRQNTSTTPTIISCSNFVFSSPEDWPDHIYNTGYWFLNDQDGWEPPGELLAFLEAGQPPVYVGFGSVGDPSQAVKTADLVIQALKHSGQRGILASGWQGMSKRDNFPDEIFILESAPHSWLFPRMAAVVHHGGAGTTAAGLRAGVPSVVIPHSNDQFAWGRRVYELGSGPKPVPRKKLSPERLSQAIDIALTKKIQGNSQELAKKIESEHGSQIAANVIIKTL